MKYFKLFLTVCAMAVAISASAQSKTTAKSKTATTTAKTTTAAPAKKATTTAAKPATTTTTTTAKAATTTTTTTTTAKAAKETPKPEKAAKTASSASGDFDPSVNFMMETKIGSFYKTGGWGENFVLEKEFSKYFAVDFFSIDFAMPFKISDYKLFTLGLKAGARGFTPRFWGGKARGFTSLALGYDCCIADGSAAASIANAVAAEYGYEGDLDVEAGWGASHGFALSWGAGLHLVDHVYVGYTLEYSTIFKSTSHYAKIGIRF